MWHLLLSPFCMATVILCPLWAASSPAKGTGQGGLAPAACPGPPPCQDKMAAGRALGRSHAAPSAPGPRRAQAPHAQPGRHEVPTNSPCCGDVAPGNGGGKGGPRVAFILEVNVRLGGKLRWAERRAAVPGRCCVWSDAVRSCSHPACRYLTQDLDLLYYSLILPLCKVTSVLVTVITGVQLLARLMKNYQSLRQSKDQCPESPPSRVWGAADCPECAICLQTCQPGQGLKLLSCCHAYHGKCIDRWHRAQPGDKTCPLCLSSVTGVALVFLRAHRGQ